MSTPYYQVPADAIAAGNTSQPVTRWLRLNKYVAITGGACLTLPFLLIVSTATSAFHNIDAAEPTSLFGLSRSLRSPFAGSASFAMTSTGGSSKSLSRYGIGSSPLERLAILAIEANQLDNQVRDTSMRTAMRATIVQAENDAVKDMDAETKAEVARYMKAAIVRADTVKSVNTAARNMAGVTGPMGFFDPLRLSTKISEGRLLFFREAELKHGRVCMLASLGIYVGEQFHPLFGGNIDVPSYVAFQETPLQTFWYAVLAAIGLLEVPSIGTFNWAGSANEWTIKGDRTPGDLGFDPFGIKPKNKGELLVLQNKELNNGRLAMIAAAGMIGQELATGKKIF